MELVAVKSKYQVVIPQKIRRSIAIKIGDYMEAKVQQGSVILTPKKIVDYSDFANADDEYTPAQRKKLDAELAKAIEEYRAGLTAGPFDSAEAMIAHMKAGLNKKHIAKKSKPNR